MSATFQPIGAGPRRPDLLQSEWWRPSQAQPPTPTHMPSAIKHEKTNQTGNKLHHSCNSLTQRPGLPYGAHFFFYRLASKMPAPSRVFWVFCTPRGYPFLLWPLGENCLHCILCWCMRFEKYLQFSKIHPEAVPDWSFRSRPSAPFPCSSDAIRYFDFCIHICIWFLPIAFGPSTFNKPAVRAKWRQLSLCIAAICVCFLWLLHFYLKSDIEIQFFKGICIVLHIFYSFTY